MPKSDPPVPGAIGSDTWPFAHKLVEEMGELTQVIMKIMGAGGDTTYYDGTNLWVKLHEELGDVGAAFNNFTKVNALDLDSIEERMKEKKAKQLGRHKKHYERLKHQ